MSPQAEKRWRIARHCAAGVCFAFALWMFGSMLRWLFITGQFNPATDWIMTVLFVLFAGSGVGFASFLGWRLIARWNSGTVRWVIGALLAMAILWVQGGMESPGDPRQASVVPAIAGIVAIIGGGVVFRRLTRFIIRVAELQETPNIYGQPAGHDARVHLFAWAMVFSILAAGARIFVPDRSAQSEPTRQALLGLIPLLLAWAAYKAVFWIFRPKTRPTEPPGGFEVLVKSQES